MIIRIEPQPPSLFRLQSGKSIADPAEHDAAVVNGATYDPEILLKRVAEQPALRVR
ncbi:hypothetical protein D3C73_1357470 [compost metagenome]